MNVSLHGKQGNYSSASDCFDRPNTLTFGIVRIILSIPGIVLNILFILTMLRFKQFRRSLIFVTLLSFGDLLLAFYAFSFGLNDVITLDKTFSLTKLECFYKRPYLPLLICGIQIQSVAMLMVAFERLIAVLFPYFYFQSQKTKIIFAASFICCLFVLVSFFSAVGVAASSVTNFTYHGLCFPSLVVNEAYGGFLYALSSVLGIMSISCYLILFSYIFYHNFMKGKKVLSFDEKLMKRQKWLLKVCCILTCSTFILVVLPYLVLFLSRTEKCPTSIFYFMRRYVSFALCINSFLGLSLSLFASTELRNAVKSTLFCKVERKESSFDGPNGHFSRKRLSTKTDEIDLEHIQAVTRM